MTPRCPIPFWQAKVHKWTVYLLISTWHWWPCVVLLLRPDYPSQRAGCSIFRYPDRVTEPSSSTSTQPTAACGRVNGLQHRLWQEAVPGQSCAWTIQPGTGVTHSCSALLHKHEKQFCGFFFLREKKNLSVSSGCEGGSVCSVPTNSCKVSGLSEANKLDPGVDNCKTCNAKAVTLSSSLNHCIQIYFS